MVIVVQHRMLARHCLFCLLEKTLPESTRREALISIAFVGVAAQALDAADHGLQAFAADQFRLLEQLVDMIIPDSDAPGARKAGVAAMIDEHEDADSAARRLRGGGGARRDGPLWPAAGSRPVQSRYCGPGSSGT